MRDHAPSLVAHKPMTRWIDLERAPLKREPAISDAIWKWKQNGDAVARRLLPEFCERDWLKHGAVAVAESETVAAEAVCDLGRRAIGRAQSLNFNSVTFVGCD